MMQVQIEVSCDQHPDLADCPESLIELGQDGRFALRIHDGLDSRMRIRHCPWCGAKLKKYSQRAGAS